MNNFHLINAKQALRALADDLRGAQYFANVEALEEITDNLQADVDFLRKCAAKAKARNDAKFSYR